MRSTWLKVTFGVYLSEQLRGLTVEEEDVVAHCDCFGRNFS